MTTTFGFCVPIFAGSGGAHPRTPLLESVEMDQLQNAVLEAENLGYDSLWVADHLILGREGFILEGWTLLSALARVTTRIRLGTIHLANRFRPPSLVAKMAATLDFISGGRLEFFFDPYSGMRAEADAYGLPFVDEDISLEQFEEAVKLIKAMWMEDRPTFKGKHYSIENAVCHPRPVQHPSIPVWIGTSGGQAAATSALVQKAAPIIARHADWWNTTPISVESAGKVLELLKQACLENGRDYGAIRKSLETQVLVAETPAHLERQKELITSRNPNYGDWESLSTKFIIGDVDTVAGRLREYANLGIECFMLWFMDYPSLDGLRLFARRVMPYFR
jgi:alkanesulfonate monooxygenase SsuD/methylene tetrahydromethanopterin reductase-like flavin-dependent oxidoreductase (luciferase family)